MFTRPVLKQALRSSVRRASASPTKLNLSLTNAPSGSGACSSQLIAKRAAAFHSNSVSFAGIFPNSPDAGPDTKATDAAVDPRDDPNDKPAAEQLTPTDVSTEKYHQVADMYLDALVAKFEALQEAREDVDVEYSAGVLTLTFPPRGTYVINKQPPNKQIWLSSPISGPKRYDYIVRGDGQHEKEGGGQGEWVYQRDGTTLDELVKKEIGVDAGLDSPVV